MAAIAKATTITELTGLGQDTEVLHTANTQTTVTTSTGAQYRTLAVADTAEAIDVSGITTEVLLMIRAVTNNLDVDLDFDTSFDADFTLKASGPAAIIPNPSGTIYVKNNSAGETPVYQYILLGT